MDVFNENDHEEVYVLRHETKVEHDEKAPVVTALYNKHNQRIQCRLYKRINRLDDSPHRQWSTLYLDIRGLETSRGNGSKHRITLLYKVALLHEYLHGYPESNHHGVLTISDHTRHPDEILTKSDQVTRREWRYDVLTKRLRNGTPVGASITEHSSCYLVPIWPLHVKTLKVRLLRVGSFNSVISLVPWTFELLGHTMRFSVPKEAVEYDLPLMVKAPLIQNFSFLFRYNTHHDDTHHDDTHHDDTQHRGATLLFKRDWAEGSVTDQYRYEMAIKIKGGRTEKGIEVRYGVVRGVISQERIIIAKNLPHEIKVSIEYMRVERLHI